MLKYVYTLLTLILFAPAVHGQNPIETGSVKWMRSLDQAKKVSEETHKPILLLFQEIPGCSTCRNYGKNVLTHPLIVEAIESLFVPLLIHNNKGGADKMVLKYFQEPAWNNPVVRIVDSRLEDYTPRIAGAYTKQALVSAMVRALEASKTEVPVYLQLLHDELNARQSGLSTTYFAMYCFWAGEKHIGNLEGVYGTTAGIMDGKEVVEVEYNPLEITYVALLQAADEAHCGDAVYTDTRVEAQQAEERLGVKKVHGQKSFKPDKTPKYYLSQTPYKYIGMTSLQACRANALLAYGRDCRSVFSPRQLEEYRKLTSSHKGKRRVRIGQYL